MVSICFDTYCIYESVMSKERKRDTVNASKVAKVKMVCRALRDQKRPFTSFKVKEERHFSIFQSFAYFLVQPPQLLLPFAYRFDHLLPSAADSGCLRGRGTESRDSREGYFIVFQSTVGASIITILLKSLYTILKNIITCTENTCAKNRHKTLGFHRSHRDLVRYKPFTHTNISGGFKCLRSRLSLGVCWWKWLTSSS